MTIPDFFKAAIVCLKDFNGKIQVRLCFNFFYIPNNNVNKVIREKLSSYP